MIKQHEFKMKSGVLLPNTNCGLYTTDICIFCNKSVQELIGSYYPNMDITLDYIKKSENILPCLSEEEYIIKKLIE